MYDLSTALKRIEELEFELSGRDEEIADLEAQIERFAANDTYKPVQGIIERAYAAHNANGGWVAYDPKTQANPNLACLCNQPA